MDRARLFRQLFTLHVMMQGKLVPCVYALMLSKQKSTYKRVFRGLKDAAEEHHLPAIAPESVLTDYEHAMLDAIHDEFPAAERKGCLFHYT